jgi:adenylate cyclase
VAEEILNLLAKLPELRVISRSSSFQFRGDIHLPDIAEKLNVRYLLEGSVRKADERIRVTAQLIDARSNTHVWSENFDRVLTDVFAIQEDIATSIAEELQLHIAGGAPRTNKTDQETYALYLQAHHLLETPVQPMDKVETLLRQALERDPDYVPALNLMVVAIFNITGSGDDNKYAHDEGVRLMRSYVDRVLAIDPNNSEAIARLGWMAFNYNNDLETAVSFIGRALSIEPSNSWALQVAADISRRLGHNSDAIEFAESALNRDPLCGFCLWQIVVAATRSGQFEKALVASERRALTHSGGWITRGDICLLQGNAREALRMYEQQEDDRISWLSRSAIAHHELGEISARNTALEELKMIDERQARIGVAEVYAWIDKRDEAFEWLGRAVHLDDPAFTQHFAQILWSPFLENLRDDPRWLELRRQANMAPERLEKLRIEMPDF